MDSDYLLRVCGAGFVIGFSVRLFEVVLYAIRFSFYVDGWDRGICVLIVLVLMFLALSLWELAFLLLRDEE